MKTTRNNVFNNLVKTAKRGYKLVEAGVIKGKIIYSVWVKMNQSAIGENELEIIHCQKTHPQDCEMIYTY